MVLDDIKVHVKFKLAALWTSVMFCYAYGESAGLSAGKAAGDAGRTNAAVRAGDAGSAGGGFRVDGQFRLS
jgi:hypothetical protein